MTSFELARGFYLLGAKSTHDVRKNCDFDGQVVNEDQIRKLFSLILGTNGGSMDHCSVFVETYVVPSAPHGQEKLSISLERELYDEEYDDYYTIGAKVDVHSSLKAECLVCYTSQECPFRPGIPHGYDGERDSIE